METRIVAFEASEPAPHRVATGPRIHVVHLTYALDVGGCEKLQVEFARWADPSRFALRFVAIESLGRSAETIRSMGFPVHSLDKPVGFRPEYIPRLSRLFRNWKADVVHTHDNGPLIYGVSAARLARVPVVVHTRHHGRLPWLKASTVSKASFACRFVDTVSCVSQDSLREGIKEGIPVGRLKTIWNGIDTSRFRYDPETAASRGPLVSVACQRPDKLTESLIRAAAIIVPEESSFEILIAGDGPPDRIAMLKRMAVEHGVEKHVRFLGNVADVPALLARCGGLVLPSTTEGVSLALLEAMACGLPVVATRVGGNPEVVEDGVTGILVPPDDDRAMAEAMLKLFRDRDARRSMGAAGRAKVVRDFEIRRMVAEYESVYLSHLHRRRRFRSISPRTPAVDDVRRATTAPVA